MFDNMAPAYIPNRSRMGSDWEMVSKISGEFDRHYQVKYNDIKRAEHNFRGYQGIDGGIWDDRDLAKLQMEDRVAYLFNACRMKVDVLTGSEIAEKLDLDWQPLDRANMHAAQLIKDLYNIDKELWDYDFHRALAIRDGNVMCGELEIMIDRSKNGLPYVRFVRIDPAYFVRDSDWLSDDEEDCESAFKVCFLSPQQLQRFFKAKGPIIEQAVDRIKRFGKTPELGQNPFEQVNREIKGDTYRTIIHYWMDHQRVKRLYGRKIGEFSRMVFPPGIDNELMERFMWEQSIDPFTLREYTHDQKVNMTTTICPTLVGDALLGNGKSEIQIGRMQQFHYSYMRCEGRDIGLVDGIKHINQIIQKDESKISDLIATAQGGPLAVNRDAIDSAGDREKIQKSANDPSLVIFADGAEMNKSRVFDRVPGATLGPEVGNRLTRMYDIIDRISGIPQAMEAMSESSGESGVLYDMKRQTARIGLSLQFKNIALMENRQGEAYLNQIRQTYNGPTRSWNSKSGDKNIVLNERIAKNNSVYIKNAPIMLPRCAVYVTESSQSLSRQSALRGVLFSLFQQIAASNPEFAALITREIVRTVAINDPKVEARMDAIMDMQEVRDFAKFKADIANMEAGTQNAILQILAAKMQTMQMMAQQGIPAEGEQQPGMEAEQSKLDQSRQPAGINQQQTELQPQTT